MKTSDKKVELLAPAGNLEKMKTAFAFGADAVYAGIPNFSLRVRINDFTDKTIAEAVEICHKQNKKIYVTINIFAHNRHLAELTSHVKRLKELGVDGLVLSDLGFLAIVKNEWPEAPIHLSTQTNCLNWRAVQFWQTQGVRRIILGREVTLKEIKEIHEKCPDMELEYFVHGAMCIAYSGRCFISSLATGRSANLGDCIQPCRWKYIIQSDERGENEFKMEVDQHGSYILNSKDLCLIKHLKELRDAGVCYFKIEGRAKSAYYQAMVAGIYSKVLEDLDNINDDELEYYYQELGNKLRHRGYTRGFLFGEKAEENQKSSHKDCEWEFCGQVSASNIKEIEIKVHNTLAVGDELEIIKPKYDIINMVVDKLVDTKTREKLTEAHGGQGRTVTIESNIEIPEYSILRRKIRCDANPRINANAANCE